MKRPRQLLLEARREIARFEREKARQLLLRAAAAAPDDIDSLLTCGQHFAMLEMQQSAHEMFLRAVAIAPNNALAWHNVAATHRFLGNTGDAERAANRAIELDPRNFEAYFLRSDLRKATAEANYIAEIEARLDEGVPAGLSRAYLLYALARELDDLGRYNESFTTLTAGAQTRREEIDYSIDNDERILAQIAACYDAEFMSQASPGCDDIAPIFVLGMPRTGTTLLERFLAGHSTISSAGELTEFSAALTQATLASAGREYLSKHGIVKASRKADFAAMGRLYTHLTRYFHRNGSTFIDKLPFNFLYVGLIRLALPNARVIHVVRDPMDTCFAVYRMLFNKAYPFSYDLGEIARYYTAYRKLMGHWNRILGDWFHTVAYEDLVADPEYEVRRVFEFLRLDFEPGCLSFSGRSDAVTTASASQVRQGVYTTSVQKWRRYEEHLGQLYEALAASDMLSH